MNVIFYIEDDYGWVLNETCGCSNYFTNYEDALAVCKKVSEKNCGNFRVSSRGIENVL